MAKITIDDHRFDTAKAQATFDLDYWDGSNRHTGMLYLSSTGIWYIYTPSQWSNRHSWEIIDPTNALERYDQFLTEKDKTKIAQLAKLDWE